MFKLLSGEWYKIRKSKSFFVCSLIAIGMVFLLYGTLYLLDAAWGFGSDQLAAPQATLMKLIIEGVMEGNLPWALVFVGVFIAIVVEILGIPVLPFAIGVYLPVQLNACIMVGGIVRWFVDKIKNEENIAENIENSANYRCNRWQNRFSIVSDEARGCHAKSEAW